MQLFTSCSLAVPLFHAWSFYVCIESPRIYFTLGSALSFDPSSAHLSTTRGVDDGGGARGSLCIAFHMPRLGCYHCLTASRWHMDSGRGLKVTSH